MRYVRPLVEESTAWELFRRQRRRFWSGLLKWIRPAPSETPRLPRVELIWLPYFLFRFSGQSRTGTEIVTVSVQGHCESFAVFQMYELLIEGEPPGPFFPPQISESRAIEVGRRELVSMLLRIRSARGSFAPDEIESQELIHYPYWIYYFRRRSSIDFAVLDAVTSLPAAGKLRGAVVSAFCTESERRGMLDNPRDVQ